MGISRTGVTLRLMVLAALLFAVIFCAQACFAYSPGDPEFRGFWVDAWGAGFLRQSQVDTLLGVPGTSSGGQIRDANCNAIVMQVRRNCDANYPSSMGEPYMGGLTPANFNALQAVINAAHDTTGGKQRVEVHAWMVTFRTSGGTVYQRHDDPPTGSLTTLDNYWPSRDNNGNEVSDKGFDPGHPLVEDYTVNVAMDLVNNFDIDGIHFDYVRFTANNQGYNPTSIARYNARYGLTGQPAPTNEQFKQWRRDQVSAVVRKVYAKTQASKPWVKVSGSFVTWNPSPTASTRNAFKATRPYYDVYCDWDSWIQEGIIDAAIPMTYYNWASLPNDYTRWMNWEKDRKGNRHMYIGPGIYLNSLSDAILELQKTRDASPSGNYAHGFCGYSYRVPYKSGSWANFSPQLLSGVTGSGTAPIPDMPWKSNPTKGHISGTVTVRTTGAWADGATVTISGPESRTMLCDGTGFYAFIDLTPGTYTVTASMAGLPSSTREVVVEVGSVTGNMYVTDFILGGPIITDIQAAQMTVGFEAITWNTDVASTSQVEYGLTANYGSITTLDPTMVTTHSVVLSGLQQNTVYHYRVISSNPDGTAVSEDRTFLSIGPPEISNVGYTALTNYGATIVWNTDQAATTRVEYGPTTAYGSMTTLNPALVTSHSQQLMGLPALTEYHYRVISSNVNGTTISGDYSFTTSGQAIITNVQVSNIRSDGATITWDTNAPADSKVSYGLTTSYGSQKTDAELVRSHSITLTGLSQLTTYNFRCNSVNPYGTYTTTNFTFTTIAAPIISGVAVSNITADSATITWTSNQPTDSTVTYGYTANTYSMQQTDPAMVTSHSVTLTGLSSATTYHFKCLSANNTGTGSSSNASFSTILGPDDIVIDDSSAACTRSGTWGSATGGYNNTIKTIQNRLSSPTGTCTWTPTLIAGNYDIYVYYGSVATPTTNAAYLIKGNGGNQTKYMNQTTNKYQWNLLASKVPFLAGTGGYVRLNNMTGETSLTTTVVADAVKFVFVGITGPPEISDVAASVTPASATITWNTDQNSTTLVEYGLTTSYGSTYTNSTEVAAHSAPITGLLPNSTYHYRVTSSNANGTAVSDNYTFRTPAFQQIIDDADEVNASYTGGWTIGSYNPTTAYNNTYRFASVTGGEPTATGTFTPSIPVAGAYDIYCHYNSGDNRTGDARYTINTASGPEIRTINQKINGSQWVLLASGLQLPAGSGGSVVLSNSASSGAVVIADGIKWVTAGVTDDETRPTITIGAPSASLTRFGPITYPIVYDDNFAVTAVTLSDASVTLNKTGTANGTVSVSGSGMTNRTVTISNITGTGTLSISIAPGTAADAAGNMALGAGPGPELLVDNTPPIISISPPSTPLTATGPVSYTVSYDGAQSVDLSAADVILEKVGTANGVVAVTGSGSTARTVTVSNVTGDGELSLSIAAGTAADAAGNVALDFGPSEGFSVDNSTVPTATIGDPSATSTTGDPVSYLVTYDSASEVNLSDSDIELNKTGTANGTVVVSGSGTSTRTVTISNISGEGTLGISIEAGTAAAATGKLAPAAGPSATFSVAEGDQDSTPPIMTSVTDDTYTTSLSSLNASWSGADPESGIARYEYAVGTNNLTALNDIRDWTDAATATSASISGLSLTVGETYYISVRAVNGKDLTSEPMTSTGVTVCYPVASVLAAKALEDGKPVALTMTVSAKFPAFFYIEDTDRMTGLRVQYASDLVSDQMAAVYGILGLTADGERAILSPKVVSGSMGSPIKPLALMSRYVGGGALGFTPGISGGTGLNNTGLLVKIAGTVTKGVEDGFYVDDGSKLTNETSFAGIKVWTGVSGLSYEGSNVIVTGPVSCRKVGITVYPQILARDIVTP